MKANVHLHCTITESAWFRLLPAASSIELMFAMTFFFADFVRNKKVAWRSANNGGNRCASWSEVYYMWGRSWSVLWPLQYFRFERTPFRGESIRKSSSALPSFYTFVLLCLWNDLNAKMIVFGISFGEGTQRFERELVKRLKKCRTYVAPFSDDQISGFKSTGRCDVIRVDRMQIRE